MKGTRWMAAGGLALALLAAGGGSCARGMPGVVLRDAPALAGLPAEADRVSATMRVEEVEARPARVKSVQGRAVVRGTVLDAEEGCAVGAGERVEVWVGGMDERVPPTPAVGASVEMVFDRNRDGVVWLDPPKRMTAWLSILQWPREGEDTAGAVGKRDDRDPRDGRDGGLVEEGGR
ncbi:MAG: hypothetical protein IJT88_07695 [Kiritimatiellae bacterium]|nr:hypothetical protein [Kiritimatiellia bacterium]